MSESRSKQKLASAIRACFVSVPLALPKDPDGRAIVVQLCIQAETLAADSPPEPIISLSNSATITMADDVSLEENVGPMIREQETALGLPPHRYSITLLEPSVTTACAAKIHITGPSIQAGCAVGCLGAVAGFSIRNDVVITGAVLAGGRLGAVGDLAAKRAATLLDPQFNIFIYAASDGSCEALDPYADPPDYLPEDPERRLRLVQISTICELLKCAVDERWLLISALRRRIQGSIAQTRGLAEPTASILEVLQGNLEARFWSQVQRDLARRKRRWVHCLMNLYTRAALAGEGYPKSQPGQQARQLMLGMRPPRNFFPLVRLPRAFRMAARARQADLPDALDWIEAVSGRLATRSHPPRQSAKSSDSGGDAVARARWFLHMTSETTLRERIDIPVDHAVETFAIPGVRLLSREACWDTLFSFYIHVMGSNALGWLPADPDLVQVKAHALLAAAFSQDHGVKGAEAMMLSGTDGGVRGALSRMAGRLKQDLRHEQIQQALHEAVAPLTPAQNLRFTRVILKRLRPLLPPDQASRPAEDFVGEHQAELIHLLNGVQNHLARAFRNL